MATISPPELVGAVLGSNGFTAAVTSFFHWLTRRRQVRATTTALINQAVQTAISSMEAAVKSATDELERVNIRMDQMDRRHAAEIAESRAKHKECEERGARSEDKIKSLESEVDRLMKLMPIAEYDTLRRPVEPKPAQG